jgi:glutathione S-transferase
VQELTLVIGNKNYSSWSLRPWLLLKQAGITFREIRIPLYTPTSRAEILRYSPAGKVPVLLDDDATVWDSLAICEHLAERFPQACVWPQARQARALARSISAEMHAGFQALRHNMSMNCRRSFPGKGYGPGIRDEIERIEGIWTDCRKRYGAGGDMLFGHFTVADAMYAPVALRFQTYGVDLQGAAGDYMKAVLALPPVQEWITAARTEAETIPQFEYY